jgi:hypothetical protein
MGACRTWVTWSKLHEVAVSTSKYRPSSSLLYLLTITYSNIRPLKLLSSR